MVIITSLSKILPTPRKIIIMTSLIIDAITSTEFLSISTIWTDRHTQLQRKGTIFCTAKTRTMKGFRQDRRKTSTALNCSNLEARPPNTVTRWNRTTCAALARSNNSQGRRMSRTRSGVEISWGRAASLDLRLQLLPTPGNELALLSTSKISSTIYNSKGMEGKLRIPIRCEIRQVTSTSLRASMHAASLLRDSKREMMVMVMRL